MTIKLPQPIPSDDAETKLAHELLQRAGDFLVLGCARAGEDGATR